MIQHIFESTRVLFLHRVNVVSIMWSELNFISIPLHRHESLIAETQIYRHIDGSPRLHQPWFVRCSQCPHFQPHSTPPSPSVMVIECAGVNVGRISFERRKCRAAVVNLLLWQCVIDQTFKSSDRGPEHRDSSLWASGARQGAEGSIKIISSCVCFSPGNEESSLFCAWGN